MAHCWNSQRHPRAGEGGKGQSPQEEAGEGRSAQAEAQTERICEHWEQIRHPCKTGSPMIAALLNSAAPGEVVIAEQNSSTQICEVEYRYHLQRLQTPGAQVLVAWAAQETPGVPYGVQFVAKNTALQTSSRLS